MKQSNESVADEVRTKFIRLPGYDYRLAGAYFITLVTTQRRRLFGRVEKGRLIPTQTGVLVQKHWSQISAKRPGITTDAFVVMPNHVHGIIFLPYDAELATQASPLHGSGGNAKQPRGPEARSLAAIVGGFKSGVTRELNAIRGTPGTRLWQPNYYERVIRNEDDLNRIRQYIIENPAHWETDEENPDTQAR